MTTLREAAQRALEQVQEFKRRWWLVPAFGNKVNKATREAITNAHSPIFELEHALRAALAEPVQEPDPGEYHGWVLREVLFEKGEPVGHREPVQEPVAHKHEWFSTGAMKPGQMRCIHCGVWNHEIPPQRPAEPVQEPVEPVAYIHRQGRHWEVSERPLADDEKARGWTEEPLFTAPPQRPAEPQGCAHCNHPLYAAVKCRVCGRVTEPVQEPVAWRFEARHIDSAWAAAVTLKHPGPEGVYMRNVTPLYTAPPQRKPLTEEEIEKAYREIWSDLPSDFDHTSSGWIEQGIRYAERAHGIGGEG